MGALVVPLFRRVDGIDPLFGVRYLLGDLVAQDQGWKFKATLGVSSMRDRLSTLRRCWPNRTVRCSGLGLGNSSTTTRQIADAGWAGVLTFPRELYLRNGILASRPATELSALRMERLPRSAGPALPGSGLRTGRQRARSTAAR